MSIRKNILGSKAVNYEWVQLFSCGCKDHIAISANQKGAYKRALQERKRMKSIPCPKCKLKSVLSGI